ncbi:MAG: hypothetical protein P4L41_00330 [Flavipsychrobacter sp.]|nr:hypothetical protein [Flavipsychrobacter sp.]
MKTEQKQKAKELYFNSHMSLAQIADEIEVDPKTLYRWAKGEAWDKLKQAALVAPAIAVENMFTQLLNLQKHIASRAGDQFPTIQEAEITRKLTSCITQMNKYLDLGMNMKITDSFCDYIYGRDPLHAMDLIGCADDYFYDKRFEAQENKVFPWHNLQQQAADESHNHMQSSRETNIPPAAFNHQMPDTDVANTSGISPVVDAGNPSHKALQPADLERVFGHKSGIFGHSSGSPKRNKKLTMSESFAAMVAADKERTVAEIEAMHEGYYKKLEEYEKRQKMRKAG